MRKNCRRTAPGGRGTTLADVALDEGGRPETELIERDGTANDIAWLRPVWTNGDWRLYEVLDYRPIVDPPARLVRQEVDRFIVATDEPTVVTIRFECTEGLVVDGPACIEPDTAGAIIAHLPSPGTYEFGMGPQNGLPGAAADTCAIPTSDSSADGSHRAARSSGRIDGL